VADFPPPRVTLGHEIAGVTENGTPVAIEPLSPCGTCAPCRRGDEHLCVDSSAMLFGVGLDGGMADRIVVPERCLVPLPAGVAVGDASLVEPLAVVVHSLRRSAARPDQRVVVIGGGTIGLCAVAAARARGCEVALVARHDAQRAAGERLGATAVDEVDRRRLRHRDRGRRQRERARDRGPPRPARRHGRDPRRLLGSGRRARHGDVLQGGVAVPDGALLAHRRPVVTSMRRPRCSPRRPASPTR
jgi:threonine dehydrogenase-like Zn-dependent dehydrogenase